jgi:uncharacterized membrane protein
MSIGPVQYGIFAFPGNQFTGEIAPALQELVDSGTIRIIDLAFVTKDADGDIAAFELSDLNADVAATFGSLGAPRGMLFNDEDLEAAGEELEPNSSAALLVWEDVWATRFAEAVRNANGIVLDMDRIPREVVEAARAWAAANGAEG